MIQHIHTFTLPAAYSLLPPQMSSPAASALLLTIGLQESRFLHRRQLGGPARGFWQFERGGIAGVLQHHATAAPLQDALIALHYPDRSATTCYALVADNDTLACVFARLLLWTEPSSLPHVDEPSKAWDQYLATWRPGKPHQATWDAFYRQAWELVASA